MDSIFEKLGTLDPLSMLAGVIAGGLVIGSGFLFTALLRSKFALSAKIVAALMVASVGIGAYLGWVRHESGFGDGSLATPAQVIDDARKTVEKMKIKLEEQEEKIDEIFSDKPDKKYPNKRLRNPKYYPEEKEKDYKGPLRNPKYHPDD